MVDNRFQVWPKCASLNRRSGLVRRTTLAKSCVRALCRNLRGEIRLPRSAIGRRCHFPRLRPAAGLSDHRVRAGSPTGCKAASVEEQPQTARTGLSQLSRSLQAVAYRSLCSSRWNSHPRLDHQTCAVPRIQSSCLRRSTRNFRGIIRRTATCSSSSTQRYSAPIIWISSHQKVLVSRIISAIPTYGIGIRRQAFPK